MPLCPPLPPPATTAATDLLHRVVTHLESTALASGPPTRPQLVIVEPTPERLRLGFTDLPDQPLRALQGLNAPPGWWAVGIVGPGRARRLTAGVSPHRPAPAPGPFPQGGWPVDVVHLVARTGDAISAVHGRSPARALRTKIPPATWSGILDDHLRRVLGVPTAPAPSSTLGFWAVNWLDRIIRHGSGGRLRRASWPDIACWHPVVMLARQAGADRRLVRWATDDVERAARLLAASWTWATLHQAARSGRDILGTTSPEVAAWTDEGLYARIHLARFPAPRELLDALPDVLAPEAVRFLRTMCRAWGIQT